MKKEKFQVLIQVKSKEKNVIEEINSYKFITRLKAIEFCTLKIKEDNIISIDVLMDTGDDVYHVVTFKKEK